MSNYVKTTNFTLKDSLPTGDPNKVVRGSEFDTEFNALQVASATKADLGSPTFTGTATFNNVTVTGTADLSGASVSIDINGGTIDNAVIGGTTPAAGTFTSLVSATADINGGTIDGAVIGGSTPAAGTFAAIAGTTGTFSGAVAGTTGTFSGAVSGTTGTFSGAVTGSNLNIANWNTAFGWGNHATAGYLTSVAFTDIDAGAITTSSETFATSDTQLPTNAAVRSFMINTYPTIVEINDLSAAVVWTTVPDAYISASSVNQHVTLEKATQTKTYTNGETSTIALSAAITSGAPVVSVTKEIPQTGVTNNDWDAAAASYTLENSAYATSLSWGSTYLEATYTDNSLTFTGGDTRAIHFKPDGTILYSQARTEDTIYQYTLSTAGDLSTATYASKSLSFASQDTNTSGMAISGDGLHAYMGLTTLGTIYQYDLSTAWDVSTGSDASKSLDLSSEMAYSKGFCFNNDGTKLYVLGGNIDSIFQYSLSSAYDISTASYTSVSFSLLGNSPLMININSDGTTILCSFNTNDVVGIVSLSTPYDLSTASLSTGFTFSSQVTSPYGIAQYNNNVYVSSTSRSFQWALGEALQLGSGSFASTDVGKTINVNDGVLVLTADTGTYVETTTPTSQNTAASGAWSMFGAVYDAVDDVLELSSVATNTFDVSTASYSKSFSVLAQETQPMGVAFNTAGTKMFVIGRSGDDVNEYTLSTGFDVSTSTYVQNFSVAAQDTTPYALAFNTDGTKMFVVGATGDNVYEYALSTGFDISTASYTTSFAVGAQDTTPSGIAFNTNGTKMFVVGNAGNDVNEYTLSTGFDVSTASFVDSFSVASQDTAPQGLAFNTDGTKMFVVGATGNDVNEYTLSTGFDVSTASFVDSFSVATQDTLPYGIAFKPDGTKMFVVGYLAKNINEYNIGNISAPAGYQPCISSNIDSTYWTDINSLTATNAVGDGNVLYAVSNNARDSWSVLDNTSGTRKIVKNNAGTWQYNNAIITQGGSLDNGAYVSTGIISGQAISDFMWRSNGTILFLLDNTGDSVRKYTASTAYDMSTLSLSQSFSVASQEIYLTGMYISEDGLHLYVCGNQGNDVNEYTLTSAFDLTTASFTRVGVSSSNIGGIYFSPDGTKLYRTNYSSASIWYWSLSTAWDISTASFISSETLPTKSTGCNAITFNSDGTLLFVNDNTDDKIYSYTLSTGWDISTIAYSEQISFASQMSAAQAIDFNADLTIMYLGTGDDFYKYTTVLDTYTTNENWVNATVNNEVQALRDSMSISINQMDSTKLNAITDANQITLGNDLDFAAILYYASGSTVPTYSGTAINYDANVINQGAVLGTDYNWDFPSSTSVRLTSLGAYNLKVRII